VIAVVLGWAIALNAPGSVAGLTSAYEGKLIEDAEQVHQTLILRDAWPADIDRPPHEIAVLVRLECEELSVDDAIERWAGRWKTADTYALRAARTLVVTAEDNAGPWSRPCRVLEVWSCFVPHAGIWIDQAPVEAGGLDPDGSFTEALTSARGWSGMPHPCARARFSPTRTARNFEVRT
jgi:hypothetical protein